MDNLKDIQIKNFKSKEKAYTKSDGKGLYILVQPNGAKYWRMKYKYASKEKLLAFGKYPIVSLKEARDKRFKAHKLLDKGIDPSEDKKVKKLELANAHKNTFEVVANEWLDAHMKNKSESHQKRTRVNIDKYLNPKFGKMPVEDISPPMVLNVLKAIESQGIVETAVKVRQTASQIFCYAVATTIMKSDPTRDIRAALQKAKSKHYPTILDPKEIGNLMLAIEGYEGTPEVMVALRITPYLMLRPGELRHMEWSEINWEKKQLEIPAEKMKIRKPHLVPLCKQAIKEIQILQPINEHRSKYVFPSCRGVSRPISENAVRSALRSLEYSKEMITPHGFRAMARTLLDEELNYRVDWIEQQLSHTVKDSNGRAYNRTQYIKQRTEMMQKWADYLDNLKIKRNSV